MRDRPKLVPELYCSDFPRSFEFYTQVAGFFVRYARPEERFAYLERDGAELMIEQTRTPDRTLLAGELRYPYGRGVNLQIASHDVEVLYSRMVELSTPILLPLEDRWYRQDDLEGGSRQFVALDPDGYLLRFCEDLGTRPMSSNLRGADRLTDGQE